MPVMPCWVLNRMGFKWGEHGNKCYTFSDPLNKRDVMAAWNKAAKQGRAIKAQGGGMITASTLKKVFGAIDVQGIASNIVQAHRNDIEQAKERKDLNLLSAVISQMLAELKSQIQISYTPSNVVAAATPTQAEEDAEFRRKVIDAIVNYPWADKGFDLLGLIERLLALAGQEILRRLGEWAKKTIAPDLSDKVEAILEKHLGRPPSDQVIGDITQEIELNSVINWSALSDAELEQLVLAICHKKGIPLSGGYEYAETVKQGGGMAPEYANEGGGE